MPHYGSGAGLVRVPNIGTGPLLKITGNFPSSGGPRTPTSSDSTINAGNNPYIKALMWEGAGLKKWLFSIHYTTTGPGFFSGGGVTVYGTQDRDTVDGTAARWFPLTGESASGGTSNSVNPMSLDGQSLEYDSALLGIAVAVANFNTNYTGTVEFFASATN